MITVAGASFSYEDAAGRIVPALRDVDFQVGDGESVAIVGATGSGKTTLVQLLNGLLRPLAGSVSVDGEELWAARARRERAAALRRARRLVGLVFQYPEYQLFEETVEADVAFGPRNLGCPEEEVADRVREALSAVGLNEAFAPRSPFGLSGGEMRRVALAGVLAVRPRYLVLDEPTAGLDPRGRDSLLTLLGGLHRGGLSVVLVTHDMDEAASLCGRIVVLTGGRVVAAGTPRQIFALGAEQLAGWGLEPPAVTRLLTELQARGVGVETGAQSLQEARDAILRAVGAC